MIDTEDAGAQGPHDHPVIATLAGCAVLVVAAVAAPLLIPQQPHATLVGAGAGLGALLWAVGFVLTTRHSTLPWKLGSLAVLVGAGIAAGLVAHGQYQTRARADASSFAEVEFGPQGAPQLPGDAASRGPISRLFVASVEGDAQDQRELGAALGKLGVGNLNSPYLLEQHPRAIANCGGYDAVKTMARDQQRRRADRRAALDQAIQAANLPEQAKRGIATMAGPMASDKDDALLANQLAGLDATSELCTLLARRSWFNQNAYFGFRNPGDQARFKALIARRMQAAGDAERIARATTERMREGREQVRDALSRSIYSGG